MKGESASLMLGLRSLTLIISDSIPFILHPSSFLLLFPSAFILNLLVRAPQLDLVLQLDAVLASEALAYLFGERERVRSLRAFALRDDEVGVDGRDAGAAALLALHPHLVNTLP